MNRIFTLLFLLSSHLCQTDVPAEIDDCKMVEGCRPCEDPCRWPKPRHACPSSSSSSCSSATKYKQEFVYDFLLPACSPRLSILYGRYDDALLQIWREEELVWSSRQPWYEVKLQAGPQRLRFVYEDGELVVPRTSLKKAGCGEDAITTLVTIGPYEISWCSEKNGFFAK